MNSHALALLKSETGLEWQEDGENACFGASQAFYSETDGWTIVTNMDCISARYIEITGRGDSPMQAMMELKKALDSLENQILVTRTIMKITVI